MTAHRARDKHSVDIYEVDFQYMKSTMNEKSISDMINHLTWIKFYCERSGIRIPLPEIWQTEEFDYA